MDIFDLRDEIVLHDYADYAGSFISISDSRIKEEVDTKFASGLLWPEPLLQLNPSFASGGSVDDLVQKKILAPQCSEIFRIGKTETDPAGRPMQLYRHQTDAILAAQKKRKLRSHHGNRIRQEPLLHHPHRGSCPQKRYR